MPFSKTLAGRLDYTQTDGGGYVDRTGDGMQSGAGSLRWTPHPSLSLKGSAVWTNDNIRSYYGTPIIDGQIDPRTRYINYNMRDNHNVATNNYYRVDADFLFRGWTLHEGVFAATQYVEWRNFESTQFVPASRLVQVGSYFLAKRDDLLLGNQIDARSSFTLLGRPVSFVTGYQFQNNDQDRWGGGTIPNQNRLVDPLRPGADLRSRVSVRLRPQRHRAHAHAVRRSAGRAQREIQGGERPALGAVPGRSGSGQPAAGEPDLLPRHRPARRRLPAGAARRPLRQLQPGG